MNSVDLDVPIGLTLTVGGTVIAYSTYGILALLTWQVVFVIVLMVYLTIILQVIFPGDYIFPSLMQECNGRHSFPLIVVYIAVPSYKRLQTASLDFGKAKFD